MTEDEQFFAWLDGELDAEEAAMVEARVAASPDLTARAAEYRRLSAGLRQAFEPILESGGPAPRFEPAEVIDFGARAAGREARRSLFGVPQWAAIAATLALGLLVGNLVGRGGDSPVSMDNGHLVAAAALDHSLSTALASTPANSGARIGLTFRDASGQICRSFQDKSASGLACRDGQQWRIEGLFQGGEGQSPDYRMAAGQDPRLAQLIDQTIAGEPFDAAQERQAMDQGWR
jgi:hypothetical protein